MINWFKKRKIKKEVEKLEKFLVDTLSPFQPKMSDIYRQAKLSMVFFPTSPSPSIQLLHTIDPSYYKKNQARHKDFYVLHGIEIRRKNSKEFIEIPIEVTWDLVARIDIDNPKDFWKYYETESLRVVNLKRTELQIINEDQEKLKKIMVALSAEQIKKIEIEHTLEIELDGKKFYTILDMEDGNYIAVNTRRQVFRLNHDSSEDIRMIDKSVENFLKEFSGNKSNLEKYFED